MFGVGANNPWINPSSKNKHQERYKRVDHKCTKFDQSYRSILIRHKTVQVVSPPRTKNVENNRNGYFPVIKTCPNQNYKYEM